MYHTCRLVGGPGRVYCPSWKHFPMVVIWGMQSSITPLINPVAAATSTDGVRPRQKSQHPRGTALFLK